MQLQQRSFSASSPLQVLHKLTVGKTGRIVWKYFSGSLRHIAAPLAQSDSGRIRSHEFLTARLPDRSFASAQIDPVALRRHPCPIGNIDPGASLSEYGFLLGSDVGC